MLQLIVRNVKMLVMGELPPDVRKEIQTTLSYVLPGFKYTPRYQKDVIVARAQNRLPWDGTMTVARPHAQTGGLVVPTGLYSYVREILIERGIEYTTDDQRESTIPTPGYSLEGLVLRDYQETAVVDGLNRQRGVMKASTGSGKTEITIAMIVRASMFPAMFYVTSCDLLEQAYDRFKHYIRYNGAPPNIGRIGAGHFDIQPITIATVQSCERVLTGKYTKYDECSSDDPTTFSETQQSQIKQLIKEAQFVYADECHHVSAKTIQTVLNNSLKARFRIGGSASPWRDDGMDLLIEAAFGRRFCDISASYLIKQGFLIRPHITFNHFKQQFGMAANFNAHYTKYIVENQVRNKWIAERALFHMERGRPTIILVKWVTHAEALEKLIPGSEILTASGSSALIPKKRKLVLNRLRDRSLMCVIGTTLLDEGVDVPAATAGIFAGGGKSSTRELQRIGRFIRKDPNDPEKDTAYIEDFYDHTKWLLNHAKERRRILSTEPEFEITDNWETKIL